MPRKKDKFEPEYEDGTWFILGFPLFVFAMLFLLKEGVSVCTGPAFLLLVFALRR